jgi:RNA polymerase sigma-70 factor (ECF subfamily)
VIDAIELDLIRDARAGDAEAFDALIGPLLQPGYSLALGMLHDREAAQDAVQEASLKAWRKLSQLRAGSEIRPWFLAIVANQCRTTLRGSWWRVLKVPIFAEREDPAAGLDAEAWRLRQLLRRLPPRDLALIVLYFYCDLPMAEVAASSGLTLEAAKSRLYRAVRRLRPLLEEDEVEQQ